MNYLKLIRDYLSLRPRGCPKEKRLLIWFNIAKYLGLGNFAKYAGHCLLRISTTLLAEIEAKIITLMNSPMVKNTLIAEGYLNSSKKCFKDAERHYIYICRYFYVNFISYFVSLLISSSKTTFLCSREP